MKQYILYPVLTLLALVLFILIVLVLINLGDEELNPEVTSVMAETEESIPVEQNGYYFLLGFSETAKEPDKAGLALVEAYEKAYSQGLKVLGEFRMDDWLEDADYFKLPDYICDPTEKSCLEGYSKNSDEITSYVAEKEFLLERYRKFITYPRLRSPMSPSYNEPIPYYSPAMNAQKIYFAHFALLGNEALANALQEDIRFWRMALSDARTMIGKMVAIAMLNRSYALYGELIGSDITADTGLLSSLSESEKAMTKIFDHEFRMSTQLLMTSSIRELEMSSGNAADAFFTGYMADLFYQRNATINMAWARFKELKALDQVPAGKLMEHQQTLTKTYDEEFEMGFHMVKNPVGKILIAIAAPTFTSYFGKIYNLESRIRLLRLKHKIAQNGLNTAQVQEFIKGQKEEYNPFTDAPADWNESEKMLSIVSPFDTDKPIEIML